MILTSLVSFCKVETRRSNVILINTRHPASVLEPECERVIIDKHRHQILTYHNRNIVSHQFVEVNGRVEE